MSRVAATATRGWLPAGSSRPLHWWSEVRLDALRDELAAVLRGWVEDWGLCHPGAGFICSAADDAVPVHGPWRVLHREGRALAWLRTPDASGTVLMPLLFPGARHTGPWARALAAGCAADGQDRLVAGLHLQVGTMVDELPATLLRLLSGAVQCRAADPPGWQLLLAQEVASEIAPPVVSRAASTDAALDNALDAISGQSLQVSAEIEGCELALGALQALQPGDVVRLRHRLDRPAQLCDGGGRVLCAAYLGQQGGRRAVELAAA